MESQFPIINMYLTGQNIKSIMKKRGITVKDIQQTLRLNAPQAIYHWFEGKSLPSVDNLYALSKLFKLPIDSILIGNDIMECVTVEMASYRRLIVYYKKISQLLAS